MSRWTASGIHLLISVGIALLFITIMLMFWYPQPYFRASGADRLLTILIGVDVVLGPLLTLIVFKAGKKTLKFDLSVIVFLQISALLYGASVVWEARPVFMVFVVDRFELVAADEELAEAQFPRFRSLSWTGPVIVAAEHPTDPQERQKIMFSAITGGKDLDRIPRYYVPFEERAKPLEKLLTLSESNKALVEKEIAKLKRDAEQVGYVPLVARKFDMAMLVDKQSGEPLTAVPVNPW